MKKIIKGKDIGKIKSRGTVLVGGCFDLLHSGHLEFLRLSKEKGEKLTVLLESDERIKNLKGKNRPLNNQIVRAKNLAKIEHVDFIVLLPSQIDSEYYYNLVKLLEPDIIAVTRGDPLTEVKKDQAKMVSAEVIEVMERDYKYSTSSLIDK